MESQDNPTGASGMTSFLVSEVNNMAAGPLTLGFQYDNCNSFLE